MIYRCLIASDTLVNAFDTCRIFETSFNFWDGDGDGWDVLQFAPNWYSLLSTKEAELVVAFCSWLVKSSSPDITGNFVVDKVWWAIYEVNDDFANFFDLLLGLSPPGVLDDNAGLLQQYSFDLSSHMLRENWKIVNLLLAWGADPHHVYAPNRHSPVAESPLSFAMYSSRAFCAFRHALHGRDFDLKDFARKELEGERPLLDAGWKMETLTALLEQDFEPDTSRRETEADDGRCDSCNRLLYLAVGVQLYWQSFLESVKSGLSTRNLCPIFQDGQPSNSQRSLTILNDSTTDTADDSALSQDPALSEDQAARRDQEPLISGNGISSTVFDRKEVWCIKCWHHFKETGRRRSPARPVTKSSDEDDASEDEFSPYLIHT